MKLDSLEAIGRALARAGVRYLVADGVAVNAHGHQRLTHDLDLVLRLDPDNVRRAVGALSGLGYRPLLPVDGEDFAHPEKRREWISEHNMEVFSMVSDAHRDTTVDLFVSEPFDFEAEYRDALVAEVAAGLEMRFVRLEALIDMKEAAARPQDPRTSGISGGSPTSCGGARTSAVSAADPWEAATREGARRAQLRRALERTVRERLEALEALAETSRRLAELGREARESGRTPTPRADAPGSP